MNENFTNMGREMNIKIHEGQMNPNRLNLKKAILRHIIITLTKIENREF